MGKPTQPEYENLSEVANLTAESTVPDTSTCLYDTLEPRTCNSDKEEKVADYTSANNKQTADEQVKYVGMNEPQIRCEIPQQQTEEYDHLPEPLYVEMDEQLKTAYSEVYPVLNIKRQRRCRITEQNR